MMLKRIYIDNFRGFVDFELALNPINLLIGPNGSGKTSLFLVLLRLQNFVAFQGQAKDIFSVFESTRWTSRRSHTFEVELTDSEKVYRYRLQIAFDSTGVARVEQEQLWLNDRPLLRFASEAVQLFERGNGAAPVFPLESSRSAAASLPVLPEYQDINRFCNLLGSLIVTQIMPPVMDATSEHEEAILLLNSRNFVSWYRFASQDQGLTVELAEELRDVLDGFSHFEFMYLGQTVRGLALHFDVDEDSNSQVTYTFNELSDGQRALIALYALMVFARRRGSILCLDEPENYLSLAEIQPWLIKIYDLCNEGRMQALIISHHPEMINYLATESGIWFERVDNGPVTAQPVVDEADTGLPIAELVARGWIGA
jgi:predicted ATPase